MAYEKNTWNTGDVITADRLNHIEEGIENIDGGKTLKLYLDLISNPVDNLQGALYYDAEHIKKFSDVYSSNSVNVSTYEEAKQKYTELKEVIERYEVIGIQMFDDSNDTEYYAIAQWAFTDSPNTGSRGQCYVALYLGRILNDITYSLVNFF